MGLLAPRRPGSSFRRDLRQVRKGWRWGHPPLVPRSAEPASIEPRGFPTDWARSPAGSAARAVLQRFALAPLIRFETAPSVSGLDVLDGIEPPVIFVANHSSHLDAPLILTSLPERWRSRTATGAAADYFFDKWVRATATALVFNAFPVERSGSKGRTTAKARELLAEGWSLLVFPEGTRSRDGWVRSFRLGAARLAIEAGVPVVPVALRGSYQAMPRGAAWPKAGRPPVRVRFAKPLRPAPGEEAPAFSDRIRLGLATALDEEATTWWDAVRRAATDTTTPVEGPEAAPWRRMWESSRPVERRGRVFR